MLVCLHGYDENASSFNIFCKTLSAYTSICIDLPFHGKTTWNEDRAVTGEDWEAIINLIFLKENITTTHFTLAGYSIGGRIAFSLFEHMPQRIDKLVLLASDGFTNNFWYWLSTQTYLGNKLFRFTVVQPAWLLKFAKFLFSHRIINFGVLKLARFYLSNTQRRKQLYLRWTCFRKCRPNFKKIITEAKQYQTPIRLVFGKFDHLILQKHATNFCKTIGTLCKLTVINSGHHLLREQYIDILTQQLHY